MLTTGVLIAGALFSAVEAAPSSVNLQKRCGVVGSFYNQQFWDYDNYGTGDWLNYWWDGHTEDMSANSGGFAGAFGNWALGDPDWSCRDDGSDTNCDLKLCDNQVLNNQDDARQAYYVLESVNRLHSYFSGLSESFVTSGLDAALSKDNWAKTFYEKDDDEAALVLKEVLNGVATVVGMGAALAGLAVPGLGEVEGAALMASAGAGSAMFTGAVSGFNLAGSTHKDDTFDQSAQMGAILGSAVTDSLKQFTSNNNDLMAGKQVDDHDIRSYIAGGAMLSYPGVDKNAVSDAVTSQLIGMAINQLWRQQMVFIMGGGACGDNEGIGSGPQDTMICRDGKAWYLYYWKMHPGIALNSHQWGWVEHPPGAEVMNQGEYSGVSVEDVLNSSLDAHYAAGLNYDAQTAHDRANDAISNGWANPAEKGASWEGIFNIPVCDVGWAKDSDFYKKEYILQPYGHESRPVWCGPICENDHQKTTDFLDAVQMRGLQSPRHLCPTGSDDY